MVEVAQWWKWRNGGSGAMVEVARWWRWQQGMERQARGRAHLMRRSTRRARRPLKRLMTEPSGAKISNPETPMEIKSTAERAERDRREVEFEGGVEAGVWRRVEAGVEAGRAGCRVESAR